MLALGRGSAIGFLEAPGLTMEVDDMYCFSSGVGGAIVALGREKRVVRGVEVLVVESWWECVDLRGRRRCIGRTQTLSNLERPRSEILSRYECIKQHWST